jgi:hypothetical protein
MEVGNEREEVERNSTEKELSVGPLSHSHSPLVDPAVFARRRDAAARKAKIAESKEIKPTHPDPTPNAMTRVSSASPLKALMKISRPGRILFCQRDPEGVSAQQLQGLVTVWRMKESGTYVAVVSFQGQALEIRYAAHGT